MICTGCEKDLEDKHFYLHTKGGRRYKEQPCRLCQAIARRKRLAEDASLTATLSTLQVPTVSLSHTDMDLY